MQIFISRMHKTKQVAVVLAGFVLVVLFMDDSHLYASPGTPPPVRASADDTEADMEIHERRWEDPDGYVGRYQTDDGEITLDVSTNYWKHSFVARLRKPLPTSPAHDLNALVEGNRLLLKDNGTIAGFIENGQASLTMPETSTPVILKRRAMGRTGTPPPEGAKVLLDKKTGLIYWGTREGKDSSWIDHGNGVVESRPRVGSLYTRDKFKDCIFYLEFRVPYNARRNGNSGIFLMDTYEVQILDSFGDDPIDNSSGSLYKIAVPYPNMAAPPLEWQSIQVEFRAPRFDEAGLKTENARATVLYNGVVIHDNVDIPHPTRNPKSEEPREAMPVSLQGYNNYVQFRNIWVKEL